MKQQDENFTKNTKSNKYKTEMHPTLKQQDQNRPR